MSPTSDNVMENQAQPGVHYGQEENIELVNLEDLFKKQLEETRRLERETRERTEKGEKDFWKIPQK